MFLNPSRSLPSAGQSKTLLVCLWSPFSITSKFHTKFRSKSQCKPWATLPTERNVGITFKAGAIKSIYTAVTARKNEPTWIFSRTTSKASDDQHKLTFDSEFRRPEKKSKREFLETINIFKANVKSKSSPVDFIRTALSHMKAYGVERDLECYKKIIDVLPKGVFICTNVFMAEGMFFPRQQFVTLEALNQMDSHGVIPDSELGDILNRTFGVKSHPYQKFARMMYWALKLKNKSPWLLPNHLPLDSLKLAKLAIQRITSVDIQTEISVYETNTVEESLDHTWIVSGQSPKQRKLLGKHPRNIPVVVEGGEVVWLREKSIGYFVLKADGEPLPYVPPENADDISNLKSKFFNPNYIVKEDDSQSVHVQDDGTIYGVCATGTSSKDSLLSWVRILERQGNPALADVPVLFRFKQQPKTPSCFTEAITTTQ